MPYVGAPLHRADFSSEINVSGDLTVDTNVMFVDSTNNRVGIGTVSPANSLHVESSGNYQLRMKGVGSQYAELGIDDNNRFRIYSNGAERMRIDSSGNVGIGTTSPQRNLHVNGTEGVIRYTSTASGNNGLEVGVGTSSQAFLWHGENSYMHFATNNTERMRIDSSGRLLIGHTTANGYALDVAKANLGAAGFNRTGTDGEIVALMKDGSTVGSLTSSGGSMEVTGVSTVRQDSTTSSVTMAGGNASNSGANIAAYGPSHSSLANVVRFRNGSSETLRIDSLGRPFIVGAYTYTTAASANMFVASSGQFFRSTSSNRYKNTVNDATHGLTELLTLRPVTYKGNNDGDTVFGGLIAEEVHAAGLTEFIEYSQDDNGDDQPESIHYAHMVSLCIKSIQELKAKLDAAEARITTLENA